MKAVAFFIFKIAGMLQTPQVFPLTSYFESAKGVQCLRPGQIIGDKSHQIPSLARVCPPGHPKTPLWTEIELKNTRLVIDGSALYHYLYKSEELDCRCGGQYDEFYNVVFSFFSALNSKGIKSFVVLDGPRNITLDRDKERAKEMIEEANKLATDLGSTAFLSPLLSKLVFIEALRALTDRGIKFTEFAVCDR